MLSSMNATINHYSTFNHLYGMKFFLLECWLQLIIKHLNCVLTLYLMDVYPKQGLPGTNIIIMLKCPFVANYSLLSRCFFFII